jgi:hypothetical protein
MIFNQMLTKDKVKKTIDRLKNNMTCPAGRRVTLTYFITGPLAVIKFANSFKYE